MSILDIAHDILNDVFNDSDLFFSENQLKRPLVKNTFASENINETEDFTCMVCRVNYDESMKGKVPDGAVKILITETSLATKPDKGDLINIDGNRWRIVAVEIDPANAIWVCQALGA